MIGRGIGIPFRHGTGGGGTTDIPPAIKKSIIAWYNPKKQKLTNYDVIESYAEDFTNWAYRNTRGTAKITNNTIVITNVVEINNIVEDDNEPYSDLTIRVTGVTENKYLIVRQGRGKPETHIKKDGVYTFKDNNLYFGFGVSVIGECNITITQLPTSILKDFSGNGYDAYMYGFQGKLNSGVGIYAVDFTTYSKTNNVTDVSHNTVKVVPAASNYLFVIYALIEIPAYTVNVQNLGNNVLVYQYATENGRREITLTEGINKIPKSIKTDTSYQIGFRVIHGTGEITITQIPDYPNSLCYNGKSYAVAYGLPILTDYTVIAERTWFAEKVNNGIFMSKALKQNGAFILEYKQGDKWNTYSYYSATNINIDKDNSIVYQTKNKYNEQTIYPGDKQDTDTLFIGTIRKDDLRSFIGCHGTIIVADRSFTEEEINWLKQNWNKI